MNMYTYTNFINSLAKHGASYNTFYRRVKGKSPTLLVVRTTENEVSLCVCEWRERERKREGQM